MKVLVAFIVVCSLFTLGMSNMDEYRASKIETKEVCYTCPKCGEINYCDVIYIDTCERKAGPYCLKCLTKFLDDHTPKVVTHKIGGACDQ